MTNRYLSKFELVLDSPRVTGTCRGRMPENAEKVMKQNVVKRKRRVENLGEYDGFIAIFGNRCILFLSKFELFLDPPLFTLVYTGRIHENDEKKMNAKNMQEHNEFIANFGFETSKNESKTVVEDWKSRLK